MRKKAGGKALAGPKLGNAWLPPEIIFRGPDVQFSPKHRVKTKKKVFDFQFPPKILTARFATWYEKPTSRDGAPFYVRGPSDWGVQGVLVSALGIGNTVFNNPGIETSRISAAVTRYERTVIIFEPAGSEILSKSNSNSSQSETKTCNYMIIRKDFCYNSDF